MKKSGLQPSDQAEILKWIAQTPGIHEVILFGSRALGQARAGSDVDLAIRCTADANPANVVRQLSTRLNESSQLPYRFDVIAIELTTHQGLLEHIGRFGRRIWPLESGAQF